MGSGFRGTGGCSNDLFSIAWSSEAVWYPCAKLLKREMLGFYKSLYIVKTIWTLQSIYLAVKGTTDSFGKQKVFTQNWRLSADSTAVPVMTTPMKKTSLVKRKKEKVCLISLFDCNNIISRKD